MRSDSTDKVIDYIENTFVQETEVLTDIRRQAEVLDRLGMQVSPYEARLLQVLAKSIQAKKAVEIGTFLGYSTIHLAQVVERVFTCEKNVENAKRAEENFRRAGLAEKIQLQVGEATEELAKIESHGPFDLVFIDANKSAYPAYLAWAEKNLRPGGMVIGDNTLLFGHVYAESKPDKISQAQWQGMREFNQRLADEKYWLAVMVPTSEGLTVGVKL